MSSLLRGHKTLVCYLISLCHGFFFSKIGEVVNFSQNAMRIEELIFLKFLHEQLEELMLVISNSKSADRKARLEF